MMPIPVVVVLAVTVFAVGWWVLGKVGKSGWLHLLLRIALLIVIGMVVLQSTRQDSTAVSSEYVDAEGNLIQPIDTAQVVKTNLSVTTSAAGALVPLKQISLQFEGTGVVDEVLVRVGQSVRAGDRLATLRATALQAELLNAQAALEEAQLNYTALTQPPRPIDVQVAQAALRQAQASLVASGQRSTAEEIEIARLQVELAKNALWQAQLSRGLAGGSTALTPLEEVTGSIVSTNAGLIVATSEITVAEARFQEITTRPANAGSVSAAQARLVQATIDLETLLKGPTAERRKRAELDVETAKLAVLQAEDRLRQSVLTAPINGVIAALNLTVGQFPARDRAIVLIDNSTYLLDLNIDESEIASIQTGQGARITLDALSGQVFDGEVTRIGVVPGAPTASSTRVTYTIQITVGGDTLFRAGMRATGVITTRVLNDVLALPNRFVQIDPVTQESFAIVLQPDGSYARVTIQIGIRTREQSQIISGLSADQIVVLLPELTPADSGISLF